MNFNSSGLRLEVGKTYVIPLKEGFVQKRKDDYWGQATGRSSIGRLDVLVRLIVDYSKRYDELPSKNVGEWLNDDTRELKFYIEITALTFNIKIRPDDTLNQLRIICGNPKLSLIEASSLHFFGNPVRDRDGQPLLGDYEGDLSVNLLPIAFPNGKSGSAFCAKKDSNICINIWKSSNKVSSNECWNLMPNESDETFKVVKEDFYIIRSWERFKLPGDVAVYARAVTEALGELRIHYAGFVHPWFGYDQPKGTPLIFEVRGHNIPTYLRKREALAHLEFYWTSKESDIPKKDPKKKPYDTQELTLSNYFKPWGE